MHTALGRRALVTAALLLLGRKAFAVPSKATARWRYAVDGLFADLCSGELRAVDWQRCIETVYEKTDLAALIRELELEKLDATQRHAGNLGAVAEVPLNGSTTWGHQLFSYRRGAQTPPHAHNNVASAHVVLWGQVHVRTWHRVADAPGHLILEPTRDVIARAGDVITMTDDRDNVHAFTGLTPSSATLDVAASNVDPVRSYDTPAEGHGQLFVNPNVPADAHGRLAAPIIPFAEAVKAARAAPARRGRAGPPRSW